VVAIIKAAGIRPFTAATIALLLLFENEAKMNTAPGYVLGYADLEPVSVRPGTSFRSWNRQGPAGELLAWIAETFLDESGGAIGTRSSRVVG
jgi:hypothetical protein